MNKSHIKIAETILRILKNESWKNILLKEIKKKSKVNSFDKIINNKKDMLKIINRYFDYKMKLQASKIEESNNKDMIFEILMMRFDILQSYRKGIISIFNSFKSNPNELIFLLPDLLNSVIQMIGYSNVSTKGFLGQMKVKGIFLIYISSFFIWTKDDTISMEKTMISLDNYLDQANKILKFIK